ncbi:MAG TPA: protein translocase subunit SecD [Vicinamibacterales bacterium]|nr:protein translocase subunit SecD [Vicinamibacterales bacterium]
MYKNLRWKLLTIAAVAAIAIYAFVPVGEKVKLGLDLKGGIHLVLKVNTDDALALETQTTAEQFREELVGAGFTAVTSAADSVSSFVVAGVARDRDQEFRRLADNNVSVGQQFDREQVAGEGALSYRFRLKPNIERALREDSVEQAIQTIERRVNELGVAEPVVAQHGTDGRQILVQLPGVSDINRAKEIIRSTAMLELKIVEGGPAPTEEALLASHGATPPADMMVVTGVDGERLAQSFYLVRRTPAITGRDLRTARAQIDQNGAPAVGFSLNSDGAAKFGRVTGENVGRQLAIILDGRVESAPRIDERISGEGQIHGSFTQQEAADLALVLRSGALPASLDYLEQREVGPSLGRESIVAGVTASVAGLIFVALFMLVYYRLAGVNAIVSVVMNLVILLGFMAYLGAVLTLPGIAGFILTIGMGVDSNVLIFERIREELAAGRSARQAVAASFDRVFVTILDTHIASLIAAAFLFQFGTGPIRGFATTLFFGLVANVFTAVFVSRTIFETVLSRKPAGAVKLSI